jgi:hypothetical protein
LVEVCPWNLVQNSENFSIDFIPINASISNNTTTAPNGTTTADSLIENTATDNHFAFGDSTQQSGVEYTYSVYAKSIGGRNIRVFGSSGFGGDVIVDLANGSVLSGSGVVQSVGNGWYRISITATTTTTAVRAIFYIVNGTSISYTGNGTSGAFLWGAQLNICATAKPYFPTTDRLTVPRLTYQNGGGGCPSLLLEKQSTNLALYSQALSTSPNIPEGSTATANVYVSPDGTQNAMRFTENTVNDIHGFYQYNTVSAQTYTASVWTKQTGRRYISFYSDFTGTATSSFFDLQTISVVSSGSGHTCSIQDFGNGWFRLIVTLTATVGSRFVFWGGSPNGTTITYAGSTSISQTFWGYQLEASTYPTSYIPTTSASATRVADACFKTGISSLIGQTEGVIFYDGVLTGISNPFANLINSEKNTTGSFAIQQGLNNSIAGDIFVGSTRVVAIQGGNFSVGTRTKIAFAYKSGSSALYVNGTQIATSSATFTPIENMDDIYIGDETTYFSYKENTQVNQVALFKTRLTNAELASLTTI